QEEQDAGEPLSAAAAAAEAARVAAAEAARAAAREFEPVSVFISRKTQRLYVRQAFRPVLESPVTILDADRPVGTHVFTAMERSSETGIRWSVVTLEEGRAPAIVEPHGRGRVDRDQNAKMILYDVGAAKTALDRIVIPQYVS